MRMDLSKAAAYADKTPYELWQETEEIPIHSGLAIEDLATVPLRSWKRKGAMGAFINMLGAGRSCDAYVCEIAAQGQTLPEHYYSRSSSTSSKVEARRAFGSPMG